MNIRPAALLLAALLAHSAYAAPAAQSRQSALDAATAAYQKEDYKTAMRLLKPLAERGDALAQVNVATLYQDGLGVPVNPAEAFKWYQKAARQGHPEAQFMLGFDYSEGIGTAQNYEQAVYWYAKAAAQGNDSARRTLAGLEERFRSASEPAAAPAPAKP